MPFVALELLDGGTLDERLAGSRSRVGWRPS